MGLFKKKEPVILAESWSPICNIQAFVEKTEESVYFYLWVNPNTENAAAHACWVCNLKKAPRELDREKMCQGKAPMMPAPNCTQPQGRSAPQSEDLEIVWFEEGDAAALLECGKLLAVIPGWSGYNDFHGYSRDAVGMGPLAWELKPAEEVLALRVEKSRDFWRYCEGEYWPGIQQQGLEALEAFCGPYEKYYAIDGGKFPPKALVTARKDDKHYAFTVGAGVFPMPRIESYYQDETENFRRIELAFAAGADLAEEEWMAMLGYLSAQSGFPWQMLTWLGHGHTLPCNKIPGFEAVMFLNTALLEATPAPDLPDIRGERVNLLWVVPLTGKEYEFAKQSDTCQELLEKYAGTPEMLPVFEGKPKFIQD